MRALLAAMRIAFRAIARSKMRAALTILGILIGVMAVVVVVALGTSMRDAITRRFSTLGNNSMLICSESCMY
jgi:putative ABC transport system permease protein